MKSESDNSFLSRRKLAIGIAAYAVTAVADIRMTLCF